MELRDLTKDLNECLNNAFIPQTLEDEINKIEDEYERKRLRKKVEGGSVAALAVMGYFVTNRKHGFNQWPRDIKRCECAILKFFGNAPYDNYIKVDHENADIEDLKAYMDLHSSALKYFINDEILEEAFEIVQGDQDNYFLKCDIQQSKYEVFQRCKGASDNFLETKENNQEKNDDGRDEMCLIMAQIIQENPILSTNSGIKNRYFQYLKKYIQLGGWQKKENVKARLDVYSKILCQSDKTEKVYDCDDIEKYRYFLMLDLLYILGFSSENVFSEIMSEVIKVFVSDFPVLKKEKNVIMLIFDAVGKNYGNWDKIKKIPLLKESRKYMELVDSNLRFRNTSQMRILVTATMSAGKSTLINALTGKTLARTSQEVCTGNVCYIYNKPFEDGQTYLKTSHMNFTADKTDLISFDWDDTIYIASYFKKMKTVEDRICIIDTPGVNNAMDQSHGNITYRALKDEIYDKVLYVFNGNKLGTDEEMSHLRWVSENVSKDKVIFVINKLDSFNSRDDSIADSIERVRKELVTLGYEAPVICPISAYFALLVKMKYNEGDMTEDEKEEYALQSVKFNRSAYDLSKYYEGVQDDINDSVHLSMSKKCGLYGLEKTLFGGII